MNITDLLFPILTESWTEVSEGGKTVLKVNGKDPSFVYRVVSAAEYADIQTSGFIKPSKFYGRIHASEKPSPQYRDSASAYLLKIKYDKRDEWTAKWGDELYAVTYNKVPKSRIVSAKLL